ncbi:MAG: response regulator [Micromonosporaceae bacterium]|nr:response regulator [Micromonosporaceae bacterium]
MCAQRLLIVDDEDDIREIAQLSMEIGGWEVSCARSGTEGLRMAADHPVDVILLDVMMPDLDGPQTLQRLRSDPKTSRIPVIFLTAKAQIAEQRQLQSLGARGVIAKPFDPMALAGEVTRIIEAAEP